MLGLKSPPILHFSNMLTLEKSNRASAWLFVPAVPVLSLQVRKGKSSRNVMLTHRATKGTVHANPECGVTPNLARRGRAPCASQHCALQSSWCLWRVLLAPSTMALQSHRTETSQGASPHLNLSAAARRH